MSEQTPQPYDGPGYPPPPPEYAYQPEYAAAPYPPPPVYPYPPAPYGAPYAAPLPYPRTNGFAQALSPQSLRLSSDTSRSRRSAGQVAMNKVAVSPSRAW
jgi:hypothetical protein